MHSPFHFNDIFIDGTIFSSWQLKPILHILLLQESEANTKRYEGNLWDQRGYRSNEHATPLPHLRAFGQPREDPAATCSSDVYLRQVGIGQTYLD